MLIGTHLSHAMTEDPTILSGTLRSTLDVFNEYEDADIVCGRLRLTTTMLKFS